MKKYFCIALFLILGGYVNGQQTDCKVMLPGIHGTYTGDCKKGLAQGNGVAQGVDRYEGHFLKGLPDGKGIYRWADGSYYDGEWKSGMLEGKGRMVKGDSVITGYWKANKYHGNKPPVSYKITANRNVQRYTITKSVEVENGVRIKLMLGGKENGEIGDFSLAYTSGSEYSNIGLIGLQNTNIPLDVTIKYTTWNQLHSAQYEVLFELTILESGTWNITLTNM